MPAHRTQIADGWHTKRLANTGDRDVYLTQADPDSSLSEHLHPEHHETIWVVDGSVAVDFGLGDLVALNPGDQIDVPAGDPHTLSTPPDHDATLLLIYRPPIGPSDTTEPLDTSQIWEYIDKHE